MKLQHALLGMALITGASTGPTLAGSLAGPTLAGSHQPASIELENDPFAPVYIVTSQQDLQERHPELHRPQRRDRAATALGKRAGGLRDRRRTS